MPMLVVLFAFLLAPTVYVPFHLATADYVVTPALFGFLMAMWVLFAGALVALLGDVIRFFREKDKIFIDRVRYPE